MLWVAAASGYECSDNQCRHSLTLFCRLLTFARMVAGSSYISLMGASASSAIYLSGGDERAGCESFWVNLRASQFKLCPTPQ
jgi:hypothetical protein